MSPDAGMMARLQGMRPPTDVPGYGSDEMMAAVNARPEMAYERGPQGASMDGNDMPTGAPPQGAAGLFDSLGRVGAGLPPNGGLRPRPMPFNRPGAALGGL